MRHSTNSTGCASDSRGSKPADALNVARAVFWHDVFNLAALAAVNSLNFWYLLYGKGSTLWQLVSTCRGRIPALTESPQHRTAESIAATQPPCVRTERHLTSNQDCYAEL